MPVTRESNGSFTYPVNMYKDLYLLRYLFCDLSYDEPGPSVFCSEKGIERGTELTLLQSRSGFNISTVEGLVQLMAEIRAASNRPPSAGVLQFQKREYQTPLEMFQTLAVITVMGRLP